MHSYIRDVVCAVGTVKSFILNYFNGGISILTPFYFKLQVFVGSMHHTFAHSRKTNHFGEIIISKILLDSFNIFTLLPIIYCWLISIAACPNLK